MFIPVTPTIDFFQDFWRSAIQQRHRWCRISLIPHARRPAAVFLLIFARRVRMKFLLPLTISLLFSTLAGAAVAQDPPQQSQPPSGNSVTITGCLTKGATEGQYTITDSKTGEKVNFSAAQPLDSYLNHTVQMTGTMSSDNTSTEKSFTPRTIKTVGDTCSGSGQQ
jgi:hypothetical protein